MHRSLAGFCAMLLLAGCSFVVTVDDASYRVSVRPLAPALTVTPLPSLTPPTVTPLPTATRTPTATPIATLPLASPPPITHCSGPTTRCGAWSLACPRFSGGVYLYLMI